MATGGDDDNRGGIDKDAAIAKTAGFVVFSGIAISLLKTLIPSEKNKITTTTSSSIKSCNGSTPTPPVQESRSPPLQEPTKASKTSNPAMKPTVIQEKPPPLSGRTIEIVKGDTLWGLSRKYGVSIDAIKDANGITGDRIYAGKKLVIP